MNLALQHFVVLNTLGGTLHHYSRALSATLRAEGGSVDELSIDEPSVAGTSGARWIRGYVSLLRHARRLGRRHGPVRSTILVTWPVLGYLDLLIIALLIGRHVRVNVIVHDPIPLVRAVGYDAWSRRAARLVLDMLGHGLIVHSDAARRVTAEQGFAAHTSSLPHPLLVEDERVAVGCVDTDSPVVRVLGQYKVDRDLRLMRSLAKAANDGITFEVHGRGWPAIDGWSVTDDYVSEERLDALIATSSAILVPYRRFYQSGIAIRSIESAIPIIGPAASSLADLYPKGTELLIEPESIESIDRWLDATEHAIALDSQSVVELAWSADARSRRAWRVWAREQDGDNSDAVA